MTDRIPISRDNGANARRRQSSFSSFYWATHHFKRCNHSASNGSHEEPLGLKDSATYHITDFNSIKYTEGSTMNCSEKNRMSFLVETLRLSVRRTFSQLSIEYPLRVASKATGTTEISRISEITSVMHSIWNHSCSSCCFCCYHDYGFQRHLSHNQQYQLSIKECGPPSFT